MPRAIYALDIIAIILMPPREAAGDNGSRRAVADE